MITLHNWIPTFLQALDAIFGERVWFVGLQGSYSRGEATETSDIDMVVILDELSVSDVQSYNSMLDSLPHRELLCGFLAGKEELFHWDPSDLFQFYHDTLPIRGSLDALLPRIDASAVSHAIRTGLCNLYHGCVHNMLYEKSEDILKGLYKSASFVVQAICFEQTGQYVRHAAELLEVASPAEQPIIQTFLRIKNGESIQFSAMSETLFLWIKTQLPLHQ